MLELGELLTKVARLETELGEHVLLLSETQNIGNVEAKYSPGRTTYDWEATCLQHPTHEAEPEAWEELKATYTETIVPKPIVKTDWAGMAHRMNWPGIVSKAPVPKVTFNLVED